MSKLRQILLAVIFVATTVTVLLAGSVSVSSTTCPNCVETDACGDARKFCYNRMRQSFDDCIGVFGSQAHNECNDFSREVYLSCMDDYPHCEK